MCMLRKTSFALGLTLAIPLKSIDSVTSIVKVSFPICVFYRNKNIRLYLDVK